jgi:hypothetical protein
MRLRALIIIEFLDNDWNHQINSIKIIHCQIKICEWSELVLYRRTDHMTRVVVGLSWTRARVSNPRFGQGWTYPSRPSGSDGLGFLSGRITRARTFVWRIESDRHSCSSNAQSEFRLIQKARVERSILGLIIKFCSTDWTEQAILFAPELWASSGVLTLGLGFGFCPSNWVGLKKSVRIQPDDHTTHDIFRVEFFTNDHYLCDCFIINTGLSHS